MGIIADLSEWQGTVDFSKLSKVVDGVILRVQSGYTHPDSRYKEYVAGCKANNIPFGTYAYFKGVSIPDSIAEAQSAFDLMDKDSLFFALDIEEKTCPDLAGAGQAFIDYLKNKGVAHVGLYTGEYFYAPNNLGAIKCDFHWIANYGSNDGQQHSAPKIDNDLWQFTSVAHLDGIAGNVDESVTNPSGFNFFGNHTIVVPTVIQHVKALVPSDIRYNPSHTASYLGDVQVGVTYPVYFHDGDWHCISPDGHQWVDSNGGSNLFWVDNPALKPVYYVIRSGDNLINIAKANGTTVSQLQAWNNISDPNKIFAGQKIRVK